MNDEALADYTHALSFDPEDTWTLARRAQLYLLANEDEKAIADYSEIIRLLPDDDGAYHNRGVAYLRQRKTALADKDFKKAKELKRAK